MSSSTELTDIMKMLLDDRKRHEEEAASRERALAGERAHRDTEAKRREEALLEDRAHREVEHELRVKQLQTQLEHYADLDGEKPDHGSRENQESRSP